MGDRNKHIDDLYKDGLGDYGEAPREAMWSRIEANLDKLDNDKTAPAPIIESSNSNRRRVWVLVAALLLLSSGLFVASLLNKSNNGDKQVAISEDKNKQVKKPSENKQDEQLSNIDDVNNNTIGTEQQKNIATKNETASTNTTQETTTAIQTQRENKVTSESTVPVALNNPGKHSELKQENAVKRSTVKPIKPISNPTINEQHDKVAATPVPVNTNDINIVSKDEHTDAGKDDKLVNSSANNKKYNSNILIEHITGRYELPDFATNVKSSTNDIEQIILPATASVATENKRTETPAVVTVDGKKESWLNKLLGRKKHNTNADMPVVQNNLATSANNNIADKIQPGIKEADKAPGNNTLADENLSPKHKTLLERMALPFDLGIKGSAETGTGSYTGNKGIFSAYAELPLSKKMSLLFQPGLVLTALNRTIDYGTSPYYNNAQNSYYTVGAPIVTGIDTFNHYYIYQNYDSLKTTRKSTRPLNVGLEIPVMLKYNVSKSFALIGGVNIDVSKLFTISETVNSTTRVSDTVDMGTMQLKDLLPIYRNFALNHTSAAYAPIQQPNGNPIRLGYIIGLSYQLNTKTDIELMMTQTLSDQGYIHDINIQSLYTQPYFRFSIGYKLYNHMKK